MDFFGVNGYDGVNDDLVFDVVWDILRNRGYRIIVFSFGVVYDINYIIWG